MTTIHCERCGWSHEPPMQGGCEFENCQYDPEQQIMTHRASKIFGGIAAGFIGIVLFAGALALIAIFFDNAAERQTQRNDCLKHATNGYAYEQCR
jgi:hypothetical protein